MNGLEVEKNHLKKEIFPHTNCYAFGIIELK